MSKKKFIVLGATGVIGSTVVQYLTQEGHGVISINSKNYKDYVGESGDVLVNCNGNSYRYKAQEDPTWDFEESVVSVKNSLFDFQAEHYVYLSTIDVYSNISDPASNSEDAQIDTRQLDTYGFHKWLAERLVEKHSK